MNRCITEGRARFLKVFAELEAGEACERFGPTLAALAGGTADADAMLELRPHLRNCPACRATVRDLHATRLGRLGALWPIPALVAPLRWLGVGRGEAAPMPAPAPSPAGDDVLVPAPHLGPDDLEPVDLGKLYDAVERFDPATPADAPGRWLELKAQFAGWMHRMSGTDVVAAAQISAGTGGGRVATLGTVIGFCLSGIGAGTVCVVTGVIELTPAPKVASAPKREPAPTILPEEKRAPRREPKAARPVATHTPTPAPRAERDPAPRGRDTGRDPEPATTPTPEPAAHETAEPVPVPQDAPPEFGIEQPAVPQSQSTNPAAAPATGGGEFTP